MPEQARSAERPSEPHTNGLTYLLCFSPSPWFLVPVFFIAYDAENRVFDKRMLEAFKKENLIPTLMQAQPQAREYPQ